MRERVLKALLFHCSLLEGRKTRSEDASCKDADSGRFQEAEVRCNWMKQSKQVKGTAGSVRRLDEDD